MKVEDAGHHSWTSFDQKQTQMEAVGRCVSWAWAQLLLIKSMLNTHLQQTGAWLLHTVTCPTLSPGPAWRCTGNQTREFPSELEKTLAEFSRACSRQVLSACSASTSKQWRRGESFSVGGSDFYQRYFRGHISSSSGKLCQHVLQPAEITFAACCNAQMFMFSCCCSF